MRCILVAASVLAGVLLASLAARAQADVQALPALSASAFVDSIGLNVHFSYTDGPYGDRATVVRLIREAGVRHLRDGVTPDRREVCAVDRELATRGVRFTYIAPAHPQRRVLEAWLGCVGDATEAFEGLNEYDIAHPSSATDWVATLRSSQAELYAAVKGDARFAGLSVVGPSLTSERAARDVGDLSRCLDAGNTHDYFAGHEPETPGWGLGGYGSIGYNLALARLTSSTKPVIATETGYATSPAPRAVDEATQAAYVPRMFLAQAAAGISRTFEYELVDEGQVPFATLGIVRHDLTPKPAFHALASLLRELRSERPASGGGSLALTFDGAPEDLRRMLFLRGDGTYVLAVWRAGSLWEPRFGRPLSVGAQTATVRCDVPLKSARVVSLDAAGDLVAQPVRLHPADVRVAIGPRVTFVELRVAA